VVRARDLNQLGAGARKRLLALCLAGSLSAQAILPAQDPFSPLIRELHFSRDGRYILAETDSDISILSVRPLAILFHIPGQNVQDAQFTPDSKQIVLIRNGFHVERWSVAGRSRVSEQDVPLNKCGTERLSPDGRYIAGVDRQGTLWLLEVASGDTVLERKGFGQPVMSSYSGEYGGLVVYMDPSIAQVDFSPDGRYFVAVRALSWAGDRDDTVVWDLQTAKTLRRHRDLALLQHISPLEYVGSLGYFVFVSPTRFLLADMYWARKGVVTARLAEFPSGKEIARPKLPVGPLFRAADAAYVIVRPCGPPPPPHGKEVLPLCDPQMAPANLRAAAAEISTGQVITSEAPALDVFRNHYIAEYKSGEVGFYERGKGLQASISLHEK